MIIRIDIEHKKKIKEAKKVKQKNKIKKEKETPKYIFGEEVKTPTIFDGFKKTLYKFSLPFFFITEILLIILILLDAMTDINMEWPLFMRDEKSILVLLVIFIFILIFVMSGVNYSNKQKNALIGNQLTKIKNLDAEVSNLKMNLLNSGSGGVFNFDIENMIFHKTLKDLVKGNKHLNSAQIYTYTIYMNEESVNIRCNYVEGYVQEDNEINATLQSYYRIDNDVAKSLQYIIDEAFSLRGTNDKNQYSDKRESFLIKCNELLGDLIKECNVAIKKLKKEKDYIDKNPKIKCYPEIIRIILYFLNDDDGQAFLIEKKGKFNKILKKIGDKRLGLLGSIITSGVYALRENTTKKDKPRTYGFYRFRFRNRNYILQMEMSKVFYTTFLDASNEFKSIKNAFMSNLNYYDKSGTTRR